MLFAIARRDRPGLSELRAEVQPAHMVYQADFLPLIRYGGGLVADGTDTSVMVDIRHVIGNVLIIDLPNLAAARAFHDNDPYTKAGLFEDPIVEQMWQRVPSLDG